MRKKVTLTLSLNPGDKEKVEKICEKLGLFWGKNTPSISALLQKLAEGELVVVPAAEKPPESDYRRAIKLIHKALALLD